MYIQNRFCKVLSLKEYNISHEWWHAFVPATWEEKKKKLEPSILGTLYLGTVKSYTETKT